MTNCDKIAPMISEYVSGSLSSRDVLTVQSHIGRCEECARLATEFQSLTVALRGINAEQPSSKFDKNLAVKLAKLPKPGQRSRFSPAALGDLFALAPRRILRQSLAFGAAAAVVAGGAFCLIGVHPIERDSSPDTILATCVQQHRFDAAAQPLSDLSAQALNERPDGQDSKNDALSDTSDTENL